MRRSDRRRAQKLIDKAMSARTLEPRWIAIGSAKDGAQLFSRLQRLKVQRRARPWCFLEKPEPAFESIDFHPEWCVVFNITDAVRTLPIVAAAPVFVAPEEAVILGDMGDTFYKISAAGIFRDAGQSATIDAGLADLREALHNALQAS